MESADPREGINLCRGWPQSVSSTRTGLAHSYPATPSFETMLEIPLKVDLNSGGIVVCVRTLTASNGQRATSAMSSAEALAVRYNEVFQRLAFSAPTKSL